MRGKEATTGFIKGTERGDITNKLSQKDVVGFIVSRW